MSKTRHLTTRRDLMQTYSGGTERTTAEDALNALNGVPFASFDTKSGPMTLGHDGLVVDTDLPDIEYPEYLPTIDGPTDIMLGEEVSYQITNFSVLDTYTIEAINGDIHLVGDTIYYTADEDAEEAGFILNGKEYILNILEASIEDTEEDEAA